MKHFLKILLISILLFSSTHAGWKWNTIKNTAKVGAVTYGTKKGYSTYKKYKESQKINTTRHGVQRKISRTVKSSDEIDAIKRPLKTQPVKYDKQGRPSQRYIGEKAEVVINPETNKILSVNPTTTKKANKLKKALNDTY